VSTVAPGGADAQAPRTRDWLTDFARPPKGDREGLKWFVQSLKALLAMTLRYPYLLRPYGLEFRRAWPQIVEAFGVLEPGLQELHDAERERPSDLPSRLQDHGLTEDQLALKLAIYSDALFETMSAFARLSAHPRSSLGAEEVDPEHDFTTSDVLLGRRRRVRKAIAKAFPIGDKIVQSAGAAAGVANPAVGAAAGSVDEFKSFMGAVVRWGKKWVKRHRGEQEEAPEEAEE
jgi:hypothetical protein